MKRRKLDKIISFSLMLMFFFTSGCDDTEEKEEPNYDPCESMRMRTVYCIAGYPANGAVVGPEIVTLSWIATTPDPTYTLYLGTSIDDLKEISKQKEATYALKDLNLNTTYYWKISAVNYCGFGCSTGVLSFMTVPDINLPFVTTIPAIVHFSSPPRTGGEVKYGGTSPVIDCGIFAGLSSAPETSGIKFSIAGGTGLFSDLIQGLLPNAVYYVKAYATNSSGTSYGEEFSFTTHQNQNFESVSDTDGNVYYTVKIGDMTWFSENLRTTRFNDGSPIPEIKGNAEWNSMETPGYCWYENNPIYKTTYGALYNWYTADRTANGQKNVCPAGWHVPTLEEYTSLVTYLGGQPTAGIKLKEKGEFYWKGFEYNSGDNSSGFSALPGGLRYGSALSPASYQQFYNITTNAFFWSSSGNPGPYSMEMGFNQSYAELMNIHDRKTGLSIRCIKDSR